MLAELAWFAVFGGVIVGIVQLWGKFYRDKVPLLGSTVVGAVVGLGLYTLFAVALQRPFALAWQGLSWMVVGILFALVAYTIWNEPKT